jgi:serine/threonine protein kinase
VENYVGEKLGNYRLTHLLGVGGYAAVYLAEHMYLKTQAAIKVLRISLDPEALERFLAEARTIAHLEHPHIVRTLEFGVQDSIAYLVMSYAPNGTVLRRYPRGSIVPLHIVVQYVRQIADALQYAHAHNVIHRDVKPENMLLGRDEELLLGDFGLAVMSASSPSWKPVDRAGTIGYMAPEQIEGKPSKSSDQYGLGVVVYEWLCGRLPFAGLDKEIAARQLQGAPPPLSELAPSVPEAMAQVVMKALAKDPSKRFLSVLHFAQALEEAYQPYKLVRLLPTDMKMHYPGGRDLSLKPELSTIAEVQPSSTFQSLAAPGDSPGDRSTRLALKGSAKHTVPVPWLSSLRHISMRLTLAALAALTTISLVSVSVFWLLHNPGSLASSSLGLSHIVQPPRTTQANSGKMHASVVGVHMLPPVPSGHAHPTPTQYARSNMDATTSTSSAYTAMSTPQATPTTSGAYSPSAYTYTVSSASTPAPALAPTPTPAPALAPTPTPAPVLQPTPPGKGRLTAPGQLKKNQE